MIRHLQQLLANAPATGVKVSQQQAAEIERLEKALKVQRAASTEFKHQAGLYKRKAAEFNAAATQTPNGKRVKTGRDNKSKPIVRENQTAFGEGVRSSKMLGTRGVGVHTSPLVDTCKTLVDFY